MASPFVLNKLHYLGCQSGRKIIHPGFSSQTHSIHLDFVPPPSTSLPLCSCFQGPCGMKILTQPHFLIKKYSTYPLIAVGWRLLPVMYHELFILWHTWLLKRTCVVKHQCLGVRMDDEYVFSGTESCARSAKANVCAPDLEMNTLHSTHYMVRELAVPHAN